MRILPVLDVLAGQVVRGRAGRRSAYRPLVSRLTASTQPLAVAEAFRAYFGLSELYLADLDAIAGAAPALPLYTDLDAHGFRLWVDAGIRDDARALQLGTSPIERIVVGLETIQGPATLARLGRHLGWERLVFSLDLQAGRPLGDTSAWQSADAWTIAEQAVNLGIERLLVLDLARVGMDEGTGTEDLCQRLAAAFPQVELLAGGGIRGQEDIDRLAECGVHAVLVASALHDGRLMLRPGPPTD